MRGVALGLVGASFVLLACSGEHQGPGTVTPSRVPVEVVAEREAQAQPVADSPASTRRKDILPASTPRKGILPASTPRKQILFGDLHVHTTFSPDAFITSLPLMGGEGAHPPADACDFARFCSGLDFWSINDHAEGITPRRWAETRESIRQCNAAAGDAENPDVVAFLGWEWSQVSLNRKEHYGHKNVLFLDTEDADVPRRSIAAPRDQLGKSPIGRVAQIMLALTDWENREIYRDVPLYYQEVAETPVCDTGVDTRELPEDCLEIAPTPATLFEKLDQWGFRSLVIPHGNSWGLNTPPGTTFDKQLRAEQHDPDRQILFEVYSGHGNSEEYRDWRAVEVASDGSVRCPAPSDAYEPCCHRAGELIRARCEDSASEECQVRVIAARQNYADAGVTGYWTVPGTRVEDWLGCGQCPDCFNAPFDHRPATTAQYALAIGNFDDAGQPRHFRFGLLGSSDNHRGRPGTGYKEFARHGMTEANGPTKERVGRFSAGDVRDPSPLSVAYEPEKNPLNLNQLRHMERQASFFMTGGLVATHATGRDRVAVWEALERREVYATSGERILLWFDLLRGDGGFDPMGSEVASAGTPRFQVRAVGAFEQRPGCPDHARQALGEEGLQRLCLDECHHPGDRRRRITRIEVVRIQPQMRADEPVGPLVQDPWRVFDCPSDPAGCRAEFEDPDFADEGRQALYYARAIQEPTPAINAGGLRCERDEAGRCISVEPCYGDWRTPASDDCLAENEERAWSSPIFVTPTGAGTGAPSPTGDN